MASNPKPLGIPGAAGLILCTSGLLAWLWLGDWRWAATGGALLVLGAVLSGAGIGGAR